ncbi:MAG: hypothetical protein KF784_04035 [Fimbriimonadaceae bacterium]|nr:hypothetical protein [Fimbriimonadaceae bacterium]
MKWLIAILFVGSLLVGCQGKTTVEKHTSSGTSEVTDTPMTPEAKLQEQLRSAAFQLNAASESIAEALAKATDAESKSSGAVKEGLAEVLDFIDSAGAQISDFATDPPPVEEIKAKLAEYEAIRTKAIQAINDSIHNLEDAQGIASGFEEENPNYAGKGLSDLIGVAVADLKGALEALGGKLDSTEE